MIADCGSLILDFGIRSIPKSKTMGRSFSSMAWTAVVLAVVVVPLLTLVVDGARLFYVRGRLQTAVDAACEDAAWSAADRRAYRDGGVTTFNKNGGALGSAVTTFNQTLGDQVAKHFMASVSIQPIFNQARMECQAKASVPLVTAGGLFWSPVSIQAQSASIIRFTRK